MSFDNLSPLLWFITIIAMIPVVLWLLKRTPAGGAAARGLMRSVAVLPIAPGQRLVMVEVGSGSERRWLVLGVTAQNITALHTLPAQDEAPGLTTPSVPPTPFAQLLGKWRQDRGSPR